MASARGVKARWFWMVAAIAVASSVAGLAWGADGAKSKKSSGKAEVKAPEIVRTDDHEDVDGRTRKTEAPSRSATAPSFKPADLDALIVRSLQASKTEPSPPTTDEEFIRR